MAGAIDADRSDVREAVRASVTEAKAPPRDSLPANQQAALPPETSIPPRSATTPTAAMTRSKPLEEFGREYSKGFAGKFGEHSATGLWVVIGVVILALAGWLGWRKPITRAYESVVSPTAQPDTSAPK